MTGVRYANHIGIFAVLTLNSENYVIAIRQVIHPELREFEQTAAIDVGFSPLFACQLYFLCMDQSGDTKEGKGITRDREACPPQSSLPRGWHE